MAYRRGGKKMTVETFLKEYPVLVMDIHPDIERSWNDYCKEHFIVKKQMSSVVAYNNWFRKNRYWIRGIVVEFAEKNYPVDIIERKRKR